MTFTPDPASFRAQSRLPRRRRRGHARRVVVLALLVLGLCVVGLGVRQLWKPAPPGPADARLELARSLRLFRAGNYDAARLHAQIAARADPNWGQAQAVLARTYLALGDGVAAEAALTRATAMGHAALPHLRAHALLLQDDPDGALAEAAKADPRYSGYAMRVAARALAAKGALRQAQALLAQVLARGQDNALGWIDLGRVRLQSSDYAGAIAAATRAVALDPANPEALTLRGELVRAQYGLVAALPWFDAALKRDAYYVPALLQQAATLGDLGRYGDMLAATRAALRAQPGNVQAYYLQAVLAARAGNVPLARAMLHRVGDRLAGVPGALLLAGALDQMAGADQQAIDEWRALVAAQPFNLEARRLLGAALLRTGDATGALAVLRPAALRSDADSYTLALVGRAFEATGERDWAARYLDRAAWPGPGTAAPFGDDDPLPLRTANAARDPADPIRAIELVRGLVDHKQLPQAVAAAEQLTRRYLGAPQSWLLMGDLAAIQARWPDAVAAYRRAADLRFDEAAMLRLSDALAHAGKRADATGVVTLFLSQNPENIAARRIVAHWRIAAGQWAAAIGTLEGLRARLGSRDAYLLAELSTAYLGAGDEASATAFAEAAYRLQPMNPIAADAYGWALYQGDDAEGATALLEKAAALAPAHPGLHWHLAQLYAEADRKAEARAALAVTLADPSFPERGAAQALARELR